ncbi:MAG: O-antigen ligase family protein [Deltaproteobacteria bacterium]
MRRPQLIAAATATGAAGVGSLAMFHPLAPAAAVLGGTLVLWVFASPFRALLGFILILLLRPADMVPALAALQPARVFALVALGLWIVEKMVRQDMSWPKNKLDRYFVWLVVALLASSFRGTDPGTSFALFQDVFVKIIILYILILNLVDSPRRAASSLLVIGAATAYLGVYALQAKVTGQAQIEGSRAGFVGLLGDPNDLALCLLMGMPFLASATMETRGKTRWIFGIMLLAVVSGIVSTQSRGGFLGLGAAAFILLREKVKSRGVQFGILAVGMAVLVAASGMSSRSSGGSDGDGIDESAQGRLDAWKAGLRMAKSRPLFGVGYDRFADNYPNYVVDAVIWGKLEAHNSFVKAFAETGIFGFIPFMALVVLSFQSAKRVRARSKELDDPLERAAAGALLPTMVAYFIAAFFLSQCWSWFTYILLALVAATERTLPPKTEPQGVTP